MPRRGSRDSRSPSCFSHVQGVSRRHLRLYQHGLQMLVPLLQYFSSNCKPRNVLRNLAKSLIPLGESQVIQRLLVLSAGWQLDSAF
jgi:hypothetical protein